MCLVSIRRRRGGRRDGRKKDAKMSAATWTKCEIEFVSGNLKGIKISQWIAPRLAVQGTVVDGLLGTSSYKVISVGKSVDTYERPRD